MGQKPFLPGIQHFLYGFHGNGINHDTDPGIFPDNGFQDFLKPAAAAADKYVGGRFQIIQCFRRLPFDNADAVSPELSPVLRKQLQSPGILFHRVHPDPVAAAGGFHRHGTGPGSYVVDNRVPGQIQAGQTDRPHFRFGHRNLSPDKRIVPDMGVSPVFRPGIFDQRRTQAFHILIVQF